MIDELLQGIPLHFQKTNTLKFIACVKVAIKYLDSILTEDIGKNSYDKSSDEYLDYHGQLLQVARSNRLDEVYRPFLKARKFSKMNAPTTENLFKLANSMSGYYPVDFVTRYKGELASQYIKYVVPYTADLENFPDLNSLCDAGARIYQDLLLHAHKRTYRPLFKSGSKGKLKQFVEKIEIKPRG